ncbi:hypothetical protein HPB52_018384 [Rhipicephalus sanguineus]|uniref:Endonuclease/exonuclease/phosphatase domain-containing protein n=1 Tax=Rhipicephalus sanguineus TaxID=34632 RepID=A0A9D4YQP2_RHISA|nr:hypothetical protein HPB52_018384 [Rhipicephalus sanguineus]
MASTGPQDEPTSMQTEVNAETPATASAWTYDVNSGKTIGKEHIEWLQVGRKAKRASEPIQASKEQPEKEHMPTQKPPKQRNLMMPPFPTDDFKIVYRPQAGLDLSKWSLTAITHAIGRSSSLTQQDFYDNVRVQMQSVENIIIASTADTERATKLRSITAIQLGGANFSVNPHVRHPDDVCRGVIYGLLPGTSSAEIVAGLRVGLKIHIITFDGPHVPYYITYQSGDYRCKPYRKSVQYCRKCGAIGHRQDICPRPREDFCYKCGQGAVTEDHDCLPKCKICGQAHEASRKECKKKLRPNPPPYQVRQQLDKAKARENGCSSRSEDVPELDKACSSPSGAQRRKPGRSRSRSILRSRSTSRTRSRSRSAQCISYADATRELSSSPHNENTSDSSSAETTAFKALENRVLNQQKALQSQPEQEKIIQKQNESIEKLTRLCEEQRQAKQLATKFTTQEIEAVVEAKIISIIETKDAALVESQLTAIAAPITHSSSRTKLEPITAQIGDTFTTLSRRMDIHTAQINELKSPVTAQEHKIEGTTIEHTIVEVIPERKSQQSLYVTNVYSPPRDQLTDFDHFIRELRKRTRGHRLVVVGDFNAPHTAWGYAITTKKGARVHDVAQQHGLTLWNDPLQPTRAGNSVSRDTNPDLTFTRDVKKAGWTCLPKMLGSDHHIIQLDIGYERRPTKTGTAR